ncbi:MAG: serine/threonine-protein kinase [Bacteroidota bacterium]
MPLGLQSTNLNFETIREIGGAGKNSQVFIAHDKQLDSEIVIKKIKKNSLTYAGEYYKEAKILYNNEHSNVAKVIYGCEDSEHAYIAMPLYENGSLKDLINKRFLTVREIIRYSLQFLSGLNHIHSKKLMHFDIKPDNIFLTKTNEAVLADFGLAKAMNLLDRAEQSYIYGKLLPPEFFQETEFTLSFDIYLSGLTLYKLCNGNQHFEDQLSSITDETHYENQILNGLFPDRTNYLWHIPSSLVKIINKALAPDKANRYQTALQLMNDLSTVTDLLDWNYSQNSYISTWILNQEDKIITVVMSNNGNNFSVITKKTIKSSGNTTKVSDYCNANIISKDIKKFILKTLKSF